MLAVRRLTAGDIPAATAIIESLPDWAPGNPAAIYVAALRPTAG
jgi:hypothetical protein